jgi:hypothetical protein
MPIVGNLSEFPLPEVLLLIGSRTGCLRLYDSLDFADVEMDLSEGQAHALRIENARITEPSQMLAELSFIIETGDGMFQFTSQPVVSVKRDNALPVSALVMSLVLHVDEKLAKRQAVLAPELFYVLQKPMPVANLAADLHLFFQQSRQLLAGGVRAEDLAEYLGISQDLVQLNLYKIHELGLITLVETSDVETLRKSLLGEEISQRNDEYQFAAEASELIRRSGKLLKLPTVVKR